MTHKEQLEALLLSFDVGYRELLDHGAIVCKQGDKNVSGYSDHYVTFRFNEDGSFKQMSVLRDRSDSNSFPFFLAKKKNQD